MALWLVFGLAPGLVGVAVTGMTLHEIETWRAMHRLGRLRWLVPVPVAGARAA